MADEPRQVNVEPAALDAPAAAGEQQAAGGFSFKSMIMQMILFMLLQNLIMKAWSPAPANQPKPWQSLYPLGTTMTLSVYLTDKDIANATLDSFSDEKPLWRVPDVVFGDWSGGDAGGSYAHETDVAVPLSVQANGTWYVHAFMQPSADEMDEKMPLTKVLHVRKAFTRYLPLLRSRETKNLLSWNSTTNTSQPGNASKIFVTSAHPNLTISMLYAADPLAPGSVPKEIGDRIIWDNESHTYDPVLFINDFWKFTSDYMPLNETTPTMSLHLRFDPVSFLKWSIQLQMESSFQMNVMLGTSNAEDEDTMKRMLVETNPYLLGVTMVVSLLHTIFDCLAFKNSISFWRNRKSVAGISVRSIFTSLAMHTIIFLYLLDQDTSWLVLGSSAVGLGIELWKLQKAVSVNVDWEHRWFGVIPRMNFTDRPEYKSTTKEYDDLAFTYLGRLLIPLLVLYAAYSLVYDEHRGWYSYVVGMLAGAVYTFGFILMTPQLFINYKLKSVSHLPWRMLTYRALNTFIDDLFAFIIKMPTLHRLACFRDDVVFLIYLYQRWCYPVDPSRTHDEDDKKDDTTQDAPTTPPQAEIGSENQSEATAQQSSVHPSDAVVVADESKKTQ